jgi:DNA mismatch repair protein MutS2
LNRAEQDLQQVQQKEKELHKLLHENEKLKKEMQVLLDKEKHNQQVELLKQQNKITEERIVFLKEMERNLKQIVFDWRKAENAEDKKQLMKQLQALLFKQKEKQVVEKARKKINSKYEEVGGAIVPGSKVLMKKNHQVGEVQEIRGKKAVVKIGILPMQVSLEDLVVVEEKTNGKEEE